MPRTRKPRSNGSAIVAQAPALPTITRSEANQRLKTRAQELHHAARRERDERIADFESHYGRADRIDATLLQDLQNLQVRFAAIAARQHTFGHEHEPKVSKFTRQLGDVIGELSAHLATERAQELFAPIRECDYVGVGSTIGRKGLDESVLEGYAIVDDPEGPKNVTPTTLEDEVCLHTNVEPNPDDPAHGACSECGEEFEIQVLAEAS